MFSFLKIWSFLRAVKYMFMFTDNLYFLFVDKVLASVLQKLVTSKQHSEQPPSLL